MLRLLVLSVALLWQGICSAEQVRISCTFEPPRFVPDMDGEAKELRQGFQATNEDRVVLLELNPPAMLNTDILFRLFPKGPRGVTVDADEVTLVWRSDEHTRKPAMVLRVNRFTLEAIETYHIAPSHDHGATIDWRRRGKCQIDSRKF